MKGRCKQDFEKWYANTIRKELLNIDKIEDSDFYKVIHINKQRS